jgi:hypothetical protein
VKGIMFFGEAQRAPRPSTAASRYRAQQKEHDMADTPSPASVYLRALARRITRPYAALPETRAILLTGSSALGISDQFSDLDLTVYYDTLPDEARLVAIRQQNGSPERRWELGDRQEGGFAEAYLVEGIECQIGHVTVEAWERDMGQVLEQLDVASPRLKALDGVRYGVALDGPQLIEVWKARIAQYPDALAEAMVRHFLAFFPIWYLEERFVPANAALWRQQLLVEIAQQILGVLAGLNRRYYSTFQFKRMHSFAAQLTLAPPRLAERIDGLFGLGPRRAIGELEALAAETIALVEREMPQVDTSRVRARLGQRQQPWHLPDAQ